MNKAIELVGREAIKHALSGPAVETALDRNIALHQAMPQGAHKLPVLIVEGDYITGVPEDPNEFMQLIEDRIGPPSPQ